MQERVPSKIIRVTREPYDDHFTIFLPDGSSEYCDLQESYRILVREGCKKAEYYLQKCWNFYEANIFFK